MAEFNEMNIKLVGLKFNMDFPILHNIIFELQNDNIFTNMDESWPK